MAKLFGQKSSTFGQFWLISPGRGGGGPEPKTNKSVQKTPNKQTNQSITNKSWAVFAKQLAAACKTYMAPIPPRRRAECPIATAAILINGAKDPAGLHFVDGPLYRLGEFC